MVFSCVNPALPEVLAGQLQLVKLKRNLWKYFYIFVHVQGDYSAVICFPTMGNGEAYKTLCEVCPDLNKAAKGKLESKSFPKLSHVIVHEDEVRYA